MGERFFSGVVFAVLATIVHAQAAFGRDPITLQSCDWPPYAAFLVFNKLADGENLIGRAGPALHHDHIEISMTNRAGLSHPDRLGNDDSAFLPASSLQLITEDPLAEALCEAMRMQAPTAAQLDQFAAFVENDTYWVSTVDDYGLVLLNSAWFDPIADVKRNYDNLQLRSADKAYLSARYFTFMTEGELSAYLEILPVLDWVDRSYYLEITELQGADTAQASWRYAYTATAQAETCAAFGFGFSDYHNLGLHLHLMGAIPSSSIVTGCSTDPFLESVATYPQSLDCAEIPPDFLSWPNVPIALYSAVCPAFVAQGCAAAPDHELCNEPAN